MVSHFWFAWEKKLDVRSSFLFALKKNDLKWLGFEMILKNSLTLDQAFDLHCKIVWKWFEMVGVYG